MSLEKSRELKYVARTMSRKLFKGNSNGNVGILKNFTMDIIRDGITLEGFAGMSFINYNLHSIKEYGWYEFDDAKSIAVIKFNEETLAIVELYLL